MTIAVAGPETALTISPEANIVRGVAWRHRRAPHAKAPSLAALNAQMAQSRSQRLANAEQNCLRLTSKPRF